MTPQQRQLSRLKPSQGMVEALNRAGVPVPDNALEAVRVLRSIINAQLVRPLNQN